MNADGSNNRLLTTSAASESEPAWIKEGTKIAFLTAQSGSNQLWEMNPDGTGRKQLSEYQGDIEGFKFSPDESKVLFIAQVKYGERTSDLYPDLDKASGRVIDDLMYKHCRIPSWQVLTEIKWAKPPTSWQANPTNRP